MQSEPIQISPYKIDTETLEIRVKGEAPLFPGQLLRLETATGDSAVFGQIIGLRAHPEKHDAGFLAKLRILNGTPRMQLSQASVLHPSRMADEVRALQETPENPLQLGEHLETDFYRLGPLTLIEGPDFLFKHAILMMMLQAIQPLQRILVIDPLGVFGEHQGVFYQRAGLDLRLSMQTVGSHRLLSAFSEMFPEPLRQEALKLLAGHLPVSQDFISFSEFQGWEPIGEHPLRNLVMESLTTAGESRIFADRASEVFSFNKIIQNPINVIDLSLLSEPWKTLFYEEISLEIFRNTGGDILPVLIYPENYLDDLATWIQKADEAELSLVALASPFPPKPLVEMANNSLRAVSEEVMIVEGTLTSGLPVSIPMKPVQLAKGEHGAINNLELSDDFLESLTLNLEATQTETTTQAEEGEMAHFNQPEAWIPVVQQTEPADLPLEEEETPSVTFEMLETSDETTALGNMGSDAEAGTYDSILGPTDTISLPPTANGAEEFEFDLSLDEMPDHSQEAAPHGGAAAQGAADLSMDAFDFSDETTIQETSAPLSQMLPEPPLQEPEVTPRETHEPVILPHPVSVQTASSTAVGGFAPGEQVRHPTYGLGIISKVIPMDGSVILNINFENGGKRLLDPALCDLSKE